MQTTTVTWDPATGWSQDLAGLSASACSTLVLAFVDPQCDATVALEEIRTTLPDSCVLACSTAGQILANNVDPAPVVIAVVTFAQTTLRSGFVVRDGRESRELGAILGRQLGGDEPVAGVLVLGGGLHTNGSAMVAGLTSVLPAGTPVFGGLAADGPRFERTWVYCDGQRGEDCVAGVALLGESLELRHGTGAGWDGFGPVRTITRSTGNVLYELDGQPALVLYREYLGDRARDLPASALLFPLTVSSPDGSTSVVRTVLAVDEADQSMTFAGDVPQGWNARLMWTTSDNLMEGAAHAAETAAQTDAGLTLAVSCVGRRLVLGDRTEEELDCLSDVMGDSPIIGFYSYGEITPVGGHCALHNQTMTVTTLFEREPDPSAR